MLKSILSDIPLKKDVKKRTLDEELKLKKLLLDSGKIKPERVDMLVNKLFKLYKPEVPIETIAEAIIRFNTTD
ncbi:hypothetical protein ES708_16971 [subsurface metagenome]